MGRHSTEAETCSQALKINISNLIKKGCFQEGKSKSVQIEWQNSEGKKLYRVILKSTYLPDEKFVNLKYTHFDFEEMESEKIETKIQIETIPSNLGKGKVLYFICPERGERCRILYKAYNSAIWKSRKAYDKRLYYPSQIVSKQNYAAIRHWQISTTLEKERERSHTKRSYQGKPTKWDKKMMKLVKDKFYFRSKIFAHKCLLKKIIRN